MIKVFALLAISYIEVQVFVLRKIVAGVDSQLNVLLTIKINKKRHVH